MSLRGLDHWITEGPNLDRGTAYACDGCAEWVPKSECEMDDRGWLFCPKCCDEAEEADPAADKGDWQYHRDR